MMLAVLFSVLMVALLASTTAASEVAIVLRIGATIGYGGPCAPLYNETALGYQYFFDMLDTQPAMVVADSTGRNYTLQLKLKLVSHDCTDAGAAAAMESLIHGTPPNPTTGDPGSLPVHLLLGGNGINALQDSMQANNASRLLLHCCTARDSVFKLDLHNVYGLFTPASLYTGTVLRTMALRGLKRIAIAYCTESPLFVQLCEGALHALPSLNELRPGFGAAVSFNYSAAEAEVPGFWEDARERVAQAGADVLIACDEMERTSRLVHRLHNIGHRLSAVWLASWGNVSDFLTYLDGYGEYAMTTVQWMPSLPYADPMFGSAAEYAAAFLKATGHEASYFGAAASASGYVLLSALQRAISLCDLSRVSDTNTSDSFMWDAGALSCYDASHPSHVMANTTGDAVLSYVLRTLNMETFFGPIGFNSYRQNIFHPAIVAQVISGELAAVLPLDVAERTLVMPIPEPEPPKRWASTPAGIAIITLVCGFTMVLAVCLALAGFVYAGRRLPHWSITAAVEIKHSDIKVDIAPVLNMDGTFEPGEGVYRGTRVKLVVATELLSEVIPKLQRIAAFSHATTSQDLDPKPESNREGTMSRLPMRPPTTAVGSMPSEDIGLAYVALEAPVLRQAPRPQQELQLSTVTNRSLADKLSASFAARQVASPHELGASLMPFEVNAAGSFTSGRKRKQILATVWRAMRLQHPRICPILGIVCDWPDLLEGGGVVPVIVRQWYEFDSLDRLLENETVPLPLMTKANIVQGVAEALAYLHAQEPPIWAGSIEPSRIIMDKNFSPHLFVRLTHLDPELEPPAVPRMRSRGRGLFSASQLPITAVPPPQAPPLPQPQSLLANPVLAASLMRQMAIDIPSRNADSLSFNVARASSSDAAASSRAHSGLQPAPGDGGGGTTTSVAAAAAAATSSPDFAMQGMPRDEQTVFAFGILLCRVFSTSMRSTELYRLRSSVQLQLSPAATDVEAGRVAATGQFPPPLPLDDDTEAALSELSELCDELGDLARSCMQRQGSLTFADIVRTIAQVIIPALTKNLPSMHNSKRGFMGQSGMLRTTNIEARSSPKELPAASLARQSPMEVSSGGGRKQSMDVLAGYSAKRDAFWGYGLGPRVTPDDLLFDMFPPKVARALQAGEAVQPERYDCVSIFFSDVVGYTDLCGQLQPGEVMDLVHRLYSSFDDLIRSLRLFKVETVGDAYLAVGNLRWPQPDSHARLMTQFAFATIRAANSLPVHPERPELGCVHIRVGLHCGPVVGSVVGTLNRRYCLFGDAVNTAARMEHNSKADRVHCSAAFAALLQEQWPVGAQVTSRGVRPIKGKGPMETYWVEELPQVVACDSSASV
ncbi:hypothetical protein Agub_g1230 [Astrephomene gubernaculifera]|uniref:Guanylate cyclase domain-containing protein n=1 Tax=Astrephomene gubernaculifera TaxID=47775 RepID=A0AAD3DF55_9CHLO|nr:hypothetical protein Agub_g1230 [Astrephomene gubernaculifera]